MWECFGVQRNYRFFLTFLFVTTALDCLVFAFCWARLAYITQHYDKPNLGVAISREPANIVLIAYTFLAFWHALKPPLKPLLLPHRSDCSTFLAPW